MRKPNPYSVLESERERWKQQYLLRLQPHVELSDVFDIIVPPEHRKLLMDAAALTGGPGGSFGFGMRHVDDGYNGITLMVRPQEYSLVPREFAEYRGAPEIYPHPEALPRIRAACDVVVDGLNTFKRMGVLINLFNEEEFSPEQVVFYWHGARFLINAVGERMSERWRECAITPKAPNRHRALSREFREICEESTGLLTQMSLLDFDKPAPEHIVSFS